MKLNDTVKSLPYYIIVFFDYNLILGQNSINMFIYISLKGIKIKNIYL